MNLPTSPDSAPSDAFELLDGLPGERVNTETGEIIDWQDDDDLGMPDLGTDTGAEMDKVISASVSNSEASAVSASTSTPDGVPVAPAGSTGRSGAPAGARVTRQAEKAGFGDNSPSRGRPATGLAYQGKPATIPDRTHDAARQRNSRIAAWMDSYSPFEKDFHDVLAINGEIRTVSRAMMEVERIFGEFAAYERELNTRYEQAKSRAMVEVSGSSEKTRTAYAEILVEELRQELDEARLEVQRAERAQRMLARHLDALTVISNNLRAGLKII